MQRVVQPAYTSCRDHWFKVILIISLVAQFFGLILSLTLVVLKFALSGVWLVARRDYQGECLLTTNSTALLGIQSFLHFVFAIPYVASSPR